MALWVWVDLDYYELPLAVAGSVSELARICGVTEDSIYSARSHAKKRGYRCRYQMVEEEEEDEQQEQG